MNLKQIKYNIENLLNNTINYTTETNTYNTSNPAQDLKNSNIITDTRTEYTRILFESNDKIVVQGDYALFSNENIGYISDIHIHPDIQNKNIGTNLRQYMVDQLEPQTNIIYSYPTNEHIKYINTKKQNFKPVQNTSLNGWYFKDTS